MKKYFRHLILGVAFASLFLVTACQRENDDLKRQEKTEITEKNSLEEKETTTKVEVRVDYYIVSSNKTKLYSSPNMDSECICELYKNSLIQVEFTEDDLWKKVKIDENTYAYVSSMDVQLVGEDYVQYNDYQVIDEIEKYALIIVNVGNIRSLPDMNGEIVGKYKCGETIQVLGVTKNDWNMIMYNDNICYVSSEIITYISKEEYDSYNYKITKGIFDESNSVLIGTYTTNYASSNDNRNYNVELGVKNIDGFVIPPGSLFNWCRDMGACDEESGFKESTEIVNGEYVKGYGGGICQISSTLCAAILTSEGDFEFFERHQHSKVQKYIPREYDATVSYPNVNFIIKNCNEFPVMIKSYCDCENLIIEIYAISE